MRSSTEIPRSHGASRPGTRGVRALRRAHALLLAASLAPLALAAQDERAELRSIDTLVALNTNASVELSLIAGSMRVSTWDRNAARIVARVDRGSLELDASRGHLELRQRSERRNAGFATYEVTLPATARASLAAVSGSITADGVRGTTDVASVSGRVLLRRTGRAVRVESVSGDVEVTDAAGDVRASTVSGSLTVRNVTGVVGAETVSGPIDVSGASGERMRGETVSGSISYAGTLAPNGRYSFETQSGSVTLRIPPNTGADIAVETFSGRVVNEVPGAVRRPERDRGDERSSYHYLLGRGGARVTIDSFSGRVLITSEGAR